MSDINFFLQISDVAILSDLKSENQYMQLIFSKTAINISASFGENPGIKWSGFNYRRKKQNSNDSDS